MEKYLKKCCSNNFLLDRWGGGQRAYLQLQWSEFESQWSEQFLLYNFCLKRTAFL